MVLGHLLSMAWSFTKLSQMHWKTTPVFTVSKCPSVAVFYILYLENSDNGPEQGVKVLPVRQSVTIPLWSELTAKEVHAQDAANDRKQGLNNKTTTQVSNHTAGWLSPDFTWAIPFYDFLKNMDPLFAEIHALRSCKSVVNLGQICQGVSTKKYACSLFSFCFLFVSQNIVFQCFLNKMFWLFVLQWHIFSKICFNWVRKTKRVSVKYLNKTHQGTWNSFFNFDRRTEYLSLWIDTKRIICFSLLSASNLNNQIIYSSTEYHACKWQSWSLTGRRDIIPWKRLSLFSLPSACIAQTPQLAVEREQLFSKSRPKSKNIELPQLCF